MSRKIAKPQQKHVQVKRAPVADNWNPFPIRIVDVPYTTGKKHKRWCYHLPDPWKVEESRRKIVNMLNIPDELKQFMILVNTFYLKNEHTYVGKKNIGAGFLNLLKQKHDVIAKKRLEMYAIAHAENLLSNEMLTAEEFGNVFDMMTESIMQRQTTH